MRVKRILETEVKIGYVAAFRQLEYELTNPRFVSAEKCDGVALAMFRSELERTIAFNSREVFVWDELRPPLAVNAVRKRHVARALPEFGGRVDAVMVLRGTGQDRKEAEPWRRPGSYWQVTYFDQESGHHRVELIRT